MSPEDKPTTPQDDFNANFLESRKRIFRNTQKLLQGKTALVPTTMIMEKTIFLGKVRRKEIVVKEFALPYKSGLTTILSGIKEEFLQLGYSEQETESILEIPASENSSKPPNQIK